jgi:membrane protease YdiL (CAAX protease family)
VKVFVGSPPTPNRPLFARIFITPDERRLRSGWRLLGQFLLLEVIAVIFAISLGSAFLLSPLQNRTLLVVQVVTFLSVNISVYLARRYFDRRSMVSLGLVWNSKAIRDLLYGITLSGLMMAMVFLIEWVAGWLTFESFAWNTEPPSEVITGILIILGIFILTGWQEELLTRGYQLQNLIEGTGLIMGLVLSSIIFAILHVSNPNYLWSALIGLIAAGLFLAYGYLRTMQLWLPIGLHIGWNFFEGAIFGFPVSGLKTFQLINHVDTGPVFFTGGAFGPEAGFILLPILLIGVGLVHWYTRKKGGVIG